MSKDGYDYHHATTNTQFLALLIFVGFCAGVGLAIGIALLTFLL